MSKSKKICLMAGFAAAAGAIILSISPMAVFAQGASPFVRCVQSNLTILPDYDPRGVDGVIGPGTRMAAEAFAANNPGLRLPELAGETAEEWCRVMADSDPVQLTARIVVDTNLADDVPIDFRFGGGPEGGTILGAVSGKAMHWEFVVFGQKQKRTKVFPIGLVNNASVFCIESETQEPIQLVEAKSDLELLNNASPNYAGYCRWSNSNSALSERQSGVSVTGSDIVINYVSK